MSIIYAISMHHIWRRTRIIYADKAQNQADLALKFDVSRVRVSQVLRLLKLDNELIKILALLQYKTYYTSNFAVIMSVMLHICSALNRWAPRHSVISKDNGHERSYRLAA